MAKKTSPTDQPNSLSQQAMDFFQLKKQPFFSQMPDDQDIYTDASFEQLLDKLKHHLQFSELLLFIEGDEGSGKSTLFRRLITSDIDNVLLLPIQAEKTDSLSSLQQKISPYLSADIKDSAIEEQLKNLQLFDQSAALLVDDAHLLGDDCLREILAFRQQLKDRQIDFKLLFFANIGTASHLVNISPLQDNQLFVQQMPELTNKQVAAFIEHAFRQAGCQEGPGLSNEIIHRITERSQGNIRQVMEQALIQIEKHVHQQQQGPASRLLKKYLLPASLIIILLAVFIITQQLQKPLPAPEAFTTQALPEPQQETIETTTDGPIQDDTKALQTSTAPVESMDSSNTPAPPAEDKPAVVMEESTTGESTDTLLTAATPDSETSSDREPQASSEPIPEAPREVITAPPAIPAADKTAEPDSSKPAALMALEKLGLKDSHWLSRQNPSHWTLQILGARDPDTLLKFARAHKLSDSSAWYVTRLKGKPWYVLVHRLYSNRDTARQAIKDLPAELQKTRPWAKSIAAIQKSIQTP